MMHPQNLSEPSRCPKCGGTSWTHRGDAFVNTPDWQCNGCKGWLQDLAKLDAEKNPPQEHEFTGYMKDPNMQAACDKITAVLKEHDLMGIVSISGIPRSGWVLCLSPSWSCVRIEEHPDGKVEMRIRSKREEYPSLEAQKKEVDNTISGLMGIRDVQRHIMECVTGALMAIGQTIEIKHGVMDLSAQSVRYVPPEKE